MIRNHYRRHMGTVFSSGFEPDPSNAREVLAFVLCPPGVFSETNDPNELAAIIELIAPAKAEAVRRWHLAHQSRHWN